MRSSYKNTHVQSNGSNTHMEECNYTRTMMMKGQNVRYLQAKQHLSKVCFDKSESKFKRPFYQYADGHIKFNRFKEYYGMPKGHPLSIYMCFLGKRRTSLYISQEKGNHYCIQTRQNNLFLCKNWPEKRVYIYTKRVAKS